MCIFVDAIYIAWVISKCNVPNENGYTTQSIKVYLVLFTQHMRNAIGLLAVYIFGTYSASKIQYTE